MADDGVLAATDASAAPHMAPLACDGVPTPPAESTSVSAVCSAVHEAQEVQTEGTDSTVEVDAAGSDDREAGEDSQTGKDGSKRVTESVKEPVPVADPEKDVERTKRFAYAIASLRMYNPDFHLTPEVLDIMRVFFDDLDPDRQGTIPLRALFEEIERLDPHKELVSEETRQLMWRDIVERVAKDERIDFNAFCAWVMRWKEISPTSVQNVYTSWAKQLAVMDFGLSEGEGVFVVRADELPQGEELRFQLSELLRGRNIRRLPRDRLSKKPLVADAECASLEKNDHTAVGSTESNNAMPGEDNVKLFAPEGDEEEEILERGGDEEREEGLQKSTEESTQKSQHASVMTVSKSFIAGGLAGMVAKSALAPVDRIKLMFQVSDHRSFSFRNAFHLAKEIYVQDGFRALFRGNTLNIIRVVPYAGVQHSSFDFFRRQFHAYNYKQAEKLPSSSQDGRDFTKLSNTQLVAAGSMAGGLSLTLSYPLDIVRARFMVQHGKLNYTSIYQAIMGMYRVDGARSFTRGLLPSLMGTLPYTGIGFTLNEKFKHWMLDLQQSRAHSKDNRIPERLHPFSKLVCSYLAACVAQTATYPMDTIRRRIQTDGFVTGNGRGELRYTGIVTTARIIIANEGWRGFFKGVSVNWMRSPLATGISLTAYDLLKEVMDIEQVG